MNSRYNQFVTRDSCQAPNESIPMKNKFEKRTERQRKQSTDSIQIDLDLGKTQHSETESISSQQHQRVSIGQPSRQKQTINMYKLERKESQDFQTIQQNNIPFKKQRGSFSSQDILEDNTYDTKQNRILQKRPVREKSYEIIQLKKLSRSKLQVSQNQEFDIEPVTPIYKQVTSLTNQDYILQLMFNYDNDLNQTRFFLVNEFQGQQFQLSQSSELIKFQEIFDGDLSTVIIVLKFEASDYDSYMHLLIQESDSRQFLLPLTKEPVKMNLQNKQDNQILNQISKVKVSEKVHICHLDSYCVESFIIENIANNLIIQKKQPKEIINQDHERIFVTHKFVNAHLPCNLVVETREHPCLFSQQLLNDQLLPFQACFGFQQNIFFSQHYMEHKVDLKKKLTVSNNLNNNILILQLKCQFYVVLCDNKQQRDLLYITIKKFHLKNQITLQNKINPNYQNFIEKEWVRRQSECNFDIFASYLFQYIQDAQTIRSQDQTKNYTVVTDQKIAFRRFNPTNIVIALFVQKNKIVHYQIINEDFLIVPEDLSFTDAEIHAFDYFNIQVEEIGWVQSQILQQLDEDFQSLRLSKQSQNIGACNIIFNKVLLQNQQIQLFSDFLTINGQKFTKEEQFVILPVAHTVLIYFYDLQLSVQFSIGNIGNFLKFRRWFE